MLDLPHARLQISCEGFEIISRRSLGRHPPGVVVLAKDGPEVATRLLSVLRRVPTGGRQVHDADIVARPPDA